MTDRFTIAKINLSKRALEQIKCGLEDLKTYNFISEIDFKHIKLSLENVKDSIEKREKKHSIIPEDSAEKEAKKK